MKYLLKPKRYAMNQTLYGFRKRESKYGWFLPSQNEANILLLDEASVVKFLRSRITEDFADCAGKQNSEVYLWISQRIGKHFTELVKYNHRLMKQSCGGEWRQRYMLTTLASSPANYKIFQLEDVVSHGVILQMQKHISWHHFFKLCKSVGIENDCVYQEL